MSESIPVKKKRNVIAEWCVEHPQRTMWFGIGIMLLGVFVGVLVEDHFHDVDPRTYPAYTMLWHGLIIFGEAIAALFILHFVVESKVHERHNKAIEERDKKHEQMLLDLETNHAKILNDSTANHERLMTESSVNTQKRWDALLENFKVQSQKKIDEIQINLFKGLLQGMNIMPYEIVDYIHAAKYSTTLIRKEFKIKYKFLKEDGDKIVLRCIISFDIVNVGDPSIEELYTMTLFLQGTSFVSYELTEAIIKSKPSHQQNDRKALRKVKLVDFKLTDDKNFNLKEDKAVPIRGGETIQVTQYLNYTFTFGGNTAVSDHYHSKIYSIGIDIDVEDFPKEYEFTLIPTSPDKRINTNREGEIDKYSLSFFLPGQGFYFYIQKVKQLEENIINNG